MVLSKGRPFWGFNHEAIVEKIKAVKFCNEFCVKDNNGEWTAFPTAVYEMKDGTYTCFWVEGDDIRMGDVSAEEMKGNQFQDAVLCKKCDTIVYSKFSLDKAICNCGDVTVSGGRDELIFTGEDTEVMVVDLLNDRVDKLRKTL